LCKELEELGGGIKTRLERIIQITEEETESQTWIQEALVKFISINYNACLISYGTETRILHGDR